MDPISSLLRRPLVHTILSDFHNRVESALDLVVAIQQIPAPTFDEATRAAFIESQFTRLGLREISQDDMHNVYGCLPGASSELAPVVVSAHSDTVFADDTDLAVHRENGRLYGPGIADNALGVAGLFLLAEALQRLDDGLDRDVWFVSNVGEEGLGDLRGMRAVVDRFGEAAYLILEGGLYGYVCHEGIGVRRFRIELETPGGHSWGAFGAPSAVHEMGRMIAAITAIPAPESPKTTYNVGVVEGGTAVNAIARSAKMLLDLRSEDPERLEWLENEVRRIVDESGAKVDVAARMVQIGNRPPGALSARAPLVRTAVEALRAVGCDSIEYTTGSTDANIPLSRGLPAVCIGLSRSGNTHRPDEYMEIEPLPAGLGQALLVLLAAAGK